MIATRQDPATVLLGAVTGQKWNRVKPKKEYSLKAAIAEAVGLPPPPPPMKAVRRGPEPERLKIRGDWKAAVSKALRTPRPPGGWPKH